LPTPTVSRSINDSSLGPQHLRDTPARVVKGETRVVNEDQGHLSVPKTRTPRDLLLAALDHRRLTGYRSSEEMAWVVFPPRREGEVSLEVLHMPRVNRFRVVSSDTCESSTAAATTLGEFRSSDAAAACIEDALSVSPPQA
jgi:hypothetical protein